MATEAPARNNWTRSQTLAALHVYLQLPFGQLHQRNPKLIELAQWIGRTPGAIALKLVNLASLDPVIVASGCVGMGNASAFELLNQPHLRKNLPPRRQLAFKAPAGVGRAGAGQLVNRYAQ
jgi:putative restriction endonuclease